MSRASSSNSRRRDDLSEYWYERIASETKTVEEIRQHTIDENLSPVEKTIAMLNSQSHIQRLAGIHSISSVIISDRTESIRRLLPKFQLIIEQTVDSDEHTVAAETLVTMLKDHSLSDVEFINSFSKLICTLTFPMATYRYSTDFGAIWCQALCNIIEILPDTSSLLTLLDLVFDHSLHGSYVRDRLALILAKISTRLSAEIVESRILPVFKNFINDTNSDIRSLACQKLPILCESLRSSKISESILPLLIILSKDENLFVRQNCFESLLDISSHLNESKVICHVMDMIISLVKFGLASKTAKFLITIAQRLADLCKMLNKFRIDEYQFIHETFLRLCQEKVHTDCRLACAKNFSSVMKYLGYEHFNHEFEEFFYQFCQDNELKVRSLMPAVLIEIRKSLAQLKKHEISDVDQEKNISSTIWNGFLILLNDTNNDVMFITAKYLLEIFLLFSRDPSEGLLNGSICNFSAVADSETFLNSLLDYELRIFENTLSWRSCILCLQAFVHLPFLLSSEQIQTKILPRIYSRIFSKQCCVREIAVDSYVQLLRRIPRRSVRRNALQKLKIELLANKSYQWRLMYVRACRQILVYYSKRFFKDNFLDTILSIECESVSSVRIQLVPLLIEVKSILRLPVDQQAISKIESIMEYFLADKTITLHDLANNGLLKLDQIRSYNPALTSSNNDDDDQRKGSEESFLDELDPSSRRPPSKSTDQSSLSRRMMETSIGTKSSSLKSPRPSKSFSDEHTRKSSFSLETSNDVKLSAISSAKQRKRLTTNEGTSTSRLGQQSTNKKNSK